MIYDIRDYDHHLKKTHAEENLLLLGQKIPIIVFFIFYFIEG